MRSVSIIALFIVACGGSAPDANGGNDGSGGFGGGGGSGGLYPDAAFAADAATLAPSDLGITHVMDGAASDAGSDGGANPLCPSQPPREGTVCPREALQCRWPGTPTTWFAYCDGYNRWAVGSIDVGCPASPPENQSQCGRTVMDCDYQIGSPGDCMMICECDGIGWGCHSTCDCVPDGYDVSQCPSGNGTYSIDGNTPAGGAGGGFCPASTTAMCVETKSAPAGCDTDSWQQTCQCEADRWVCTTQQL